MGAARSGRWSSPSSRARLPLGVSFTSSPSLNDPPCICPSEIDDIEALECSAVQCNRAAMTTAWRHGERYKKYEIGLIYKLTTGVSFCKQSEGLVICHSRLATMTEGIKRRLPLSLGGMSHATAHVEYWARGREQGNANKILRVAGRDAT